MNIERCPLQIAFKQEKKTFPGVKGSAYKTLIKHNAHVVLYFYGPTILRLFSASFSLSEGPPCFLTSEL